MPECWNCGKDPGYRIENTYKANGKKVIKESTTPRTFCNNNCKTEYRKRHGMYVISKNSELKKRQELEDKAREGCIFAQSTLRVKYNLHGLWNPKTKEVVRF